ncbi:MAG: hypothetical protein AB1810_03790 [Pseudomonadota bacterium]
MKKAIVVVSLGYRPFFFWSRPSLQAYAKNIGADFLVIDRLSLPESVMQSLARRKSRRPHLRAYVQKMFSLWETLGIYDRVILLDDSCLALPSAPDLFAAVPEEAIGGFDESSKSDYISHLRDNQFMTERRGVGAGVYFNTGVLCVSTQHKELFSAATLVENIDLFESAYPDQAYLNALLRQRSIAVHRLPESWNFTPIADYRDPRERDSFTLSQKEVECCLRQHILHITGFFKRRHMLIPWLVQELSLPKPIESHTDAAPNVALWWFGGMDRTYQGTPNFRSARWRTVRAGLQRDKLWQDKADGMAILPEARLRRFLTPWKPPLAHKPCFRDFIKRTQISVVHAWGWDAAVSVLPLQKSLAFPLVITVLDSDILHGDKIHQISERVWRSVALFFAETPRAARQLAAAGVPENRIVPCNSGIALEWAYDEARSKK